LRRCSRARCVTLRLQSGAAPSRHRGPGLRRRSAALRALRKRTGVALARRCRRSCSRNTRPRRTASGACISIFCLATSKLRCSGARRSCSCCR
jgi:hypothetical protein